MNQMRLNVPPFTMTMKVLIGLNLFIWLFGQIFLSRFFDIHIGKHLALVPSKVVLDGQIWQMVTYMFMHSFSVMHIVFNMLMLWMIGSELEQRWGRKFFISYYLGTGFGAAVIYCMGMGIYSYFTGRIDTMNIPVVGASGAIFGLLLAYGILFGERIMHFMLLFPLKAKYFVMILGGIEVVSMLNSGQGGDDIAHLAHLGGLVSGYIILIGWTMWQRRGLGSKKGTKARKLRLVVNNKPEDDRDKNGPKYWN